MTDFLHKHESNFKSNLDIDMNIKLKLLLGLLSSAAMTSCYPPPQPPRSVGPLTPVADGLTPLAPNDAGLTPAQIAERDALNAAAGIQPTNPNGVGPKVINPVDSGILIPPVRSGPGTTIPIVPPSDPNKPVTFPFATPVPGKAGFVFNPYNQKKVDVRGLPSGTLVSDPRNANQKFYVP